MITDEQANLILKEMIFLDSILETIKFVYQKGYEQGLQTARKQQNE